jgi:hypothetical protein
LLQEIEKLKADGAEMRSRADANDRRADESQLEAINEKLTNLERARNRDKVILQAGEIVNKLLRRI